MTITLEAPLVVVVLRDTLVDICRIYAKARHGTYDEKGWGTLFDAAGLQLPHQTPRSGDVPDGIIVSFEDRPLFGRPLQSGLAASSRPAMNTVRSIPKASPGAHLLMETSCPSKRLIGYRLSRPVLRQGQKPPSAISNAY